MLIDSKVESGLRLATPTIVCAARWTTVRTPRSALRNWTSWATRSPSYPHTWRVKEVFLPVTDRIVADLGRLTGVRDVAVRMKRGVRFTVRTRADAVTLLDVLSMPIGIATPSKS